MTKARTAVLRSVTALALVLVIAAGCSSSDPATGEGASGESTTTASTSTAVAPITTMPRQSCSAATLGGAAAASIASPEVLDVVCETAFAAASIPNGPGGEVVALFGLDGGAWVLVGTSPVAAPASGAPAGFSPTVLPSWERLRAARLAAPEGGANKRGGTPGGGEAPPSSLKVNPDTGVQELCVEESVDHVTCGPIPTIAPPPDDDPNAPPVTVQQSMFCKYNYNDPRCVADPGFTP